MSLGVKFLFKVDPLKITAGVVENLRKHRGQTECERKTEDGPNVRESRATASPRTQQSATRVFDSVICSFIVRFLITVSIFWFKGENLNP